MEKFEKARIININKGGELNSTYENLKKKLIAVYNKVSKSNSCNDFYNKTGNIGGMQEGDEPVANAILNFIAGEKKFDTNLNVSEVLFNGSFSVMINDFNYFFAIDNENIRIIGGGKVILKIQF